MSDDLNFDSDETDGDEKHETCTICNNFLDPGDDEVCASCIEEMEA
ncbi:MAG: hypothetical protein GY861_22890, partial [bacterium]|nr:hypothetical protein [bacterium]